MVLLLAAAFFAIGKIADVLVGHLRDIGLTFGIPTAVLGAMLGLLTTTPEAAISVNALANGVPTLAVGNLIGGVPVLIGFVMALFVLAGGDMRVNRKRDAIAPAALYLLLIPALAIDGRFSRLDGALLVAGYAFLVWFFYQLLHRSHLPRVAVYRDGVAKHVMHVIVAVCAIAVLASVIVQLLTRLFGTAADVSLVVGLLLVAIGTNLPEIVVALRSSRQHMRELSLNHLVASASANGLVIGLLALPAGLPVPDGPFLWALGAYALVLGLAFLVSRTDGRITRGEAVGLLAAYLGFALLASTVWPR